MNVIKMKTQKSFHAFEQSKKVDNPICIAYGSDCPPSLLNWIIWDSEIYGECNISPVFSEIIKEFGGNKPANVIVWTNEPQEQNQWLIDLCSKDDNIIDFWFYCT